MACNPPYCFSTAVEYCGCHCDGCCPPDCCDRITFQLSKGNTDDLQLECGCNHCECLPVDVLSNFAPRLKNYDIPILEDAFLSYKPESEYIFDLEKDRNHFRLGMRSYNKFENEDYVFKLEDDICCCCSHGCSNQYLELTTSACCLFMEERGPGDPNGPGVNITVIGGPGTVSVSDLQDPCLCYLNYDVTLLLNNETINMYEEPLNDRSVVNCDGVHVAIMAPYDQHICDSDPCNPTPFRLKSEEIHTQAIGCCGFGYCSIECSEPHNWGGQSGFRMKYVKNSKSKNRIKQLIHNFHQRRRKMVTRKLG